MGNEDNDILETDRASSLVSQGQGFAWNEVAKHEPPYGKRVLIFSPDYPKGDVMRVRIVTWITKMSDATHWRELDEPSVRANSDANEIIGIRRALATVNAPATKER